MEYMLKMDKNGMFYQEPIIEQEDDYFDEEVEELEEVSKSTNADKYKRNIK